MPIWLLFLPCAFSLSPFPSPFLTRLYSFVIHSCTLLHFHSLPILHCYALCLYVAPFFIWAQANWIEERTAMINGRRTPFSKPSLPVCFAPKTDWPITRCAVFSRLKICFFQEEKKIMTQKAKRQAKIKWSKTNQSQEHNKIYCTQIFLLELE